MTEHVIVEPLGAVQLIRMNRPDKKNALTRAMYAKMSAALIDGDADPAIRVHVILGVPALHGRQRHCRLHDLCDGRRAWAGGGRLPVDDRDRAKPIVPGVDGIAVGIGTTLNLHCDLTFASRRTVFRTPFVDLGLVPEAASSLIVPAIVGRQQAFALLALGQGFSADRAKTAGLIYDVVDEDDLERDVFAAAEEIASKPAEALKIARDLLRGPREPVVARIREEAELFGERLRSDEARNALAAFMNRKKG